MQAPGWGHTKSDLKVHLIWLPIYREQILTGEVEIQTGDFLCQIAIEHGLDIITGKVVSDHIPRYSQKFG
jgi:putative transposase